MTRPNTIYIYLLLSLGFFSPAKDLQGAEIPSASIAREAIDQAQGYSSSHESGRDLVGVLANEVDLSKLLEMGVARNPAIGAAKANWQAVIEKYPQVTALPDPMIRYDYFGESVETRVGPQKQRLGFSQPFPFPGTLKAAGRVIANDVNIAHIHYEQTIRDFIVDLKLSFFELSYLQRAIEITRQNQDLMSHLLRVATTQYAKNEAKYNDVLKSESQLAQLTYDRVLLQELTVVEEAKILALLDLSSNLSIGSLNVRPISFTDTTVDKLAEKAMEQRQEILIAEHQVKRSTDAITLARYQTKPKFSIDLMMIDTDEGLNPLTPDSGKDPWSIGVGMTVPWWITKNRSQIREAEFRREAAADNKRRLESNTRSEVAAIFFRMENSRRLIELYEKSLIPQAANAMEIAEIWERDGVKDISGFLETQSVWLNFNLARLRAVTDYFQYQARLERLIGGRLNDLEREPTSGFSIDPTKNQGETEIKKPRTNQDSGGASNHE